MATGVISDHTVPLFYYKDFCLPSHFHVEKVRPFYTTPRQFYSKKWPSFFSVGNQSGKPIITTFTKEGQSWVVDLKIFPASSSQFSSFQ